MVALMFVACLQFMALCLLLLLACNFSRFWFLVMWLWQAYMRQINEGVVKKKNTTAAVEWYILSLVRVTMLLVLGH